MTLDSIVNVSITAQTQGVTQAGFGVPLIAAYHTEWLELVRTYTDLDGLVSDGFAVDSPVYLIASALLSQNPRIQEFKVGRRELPYTQIINVTPVTANETTYTLTINGTDFAYVSDATATVAEIVAGLVAAVNLGTEPVTASDQTTYLDLTADVAGEMFTLATSNDGSSILLQRQDVTADPGIATDLAAIALADDDWYGLILDSNGKAEILAAAVWVEANLKLFAATTGDYDCLEAPTTDVMGTMNTNGYARSFIMWHHLPHQYGAGGWMGERFPSDPGSSTWAYKTIAGLAYSILTSTEIANIEAKKGNYYSRIAGVSVTRFGWVSAGEWIDNVRGIDWLRARLQERIWLQLVNLEKIPYTNAGIGIVQSEIRAQLEDGITQGFLTDDPPYTVTAPAVADISQADKIARLLPDVEFLAYLAGAIHTIQIQGVVTV